MNSLCTRKTTGKNSLREISTQFISWYEHSLRWKVAGFLQRNRTAWCMLVAHEKTNSRIYFVFGWNEILRLCLYLSKVTLTKAQSKECQCLINRTAYQNYSPIKGIWCLVKHRAAVFTVWNDHKCTELKLPTNFEPRSDGSVDKTLPDLSRIHIKERNLFRAISCAVNVRR